MSHRPKNREPLPSGLGDLLGFTEASGTWIALVFTLAVLAVLIWAFATVS